ncbi:MAG: long-chain fatty acid--CoA ligase [Thermobifida sp.]|nr:long-chain fatty acid--CoA ligase [Thermobifida sp.]
MKRMRDGSYTIKPTYKVGEHDIIPDMLAKRALLHPDQVAVEQRSSVGSTRSLSASELQRQVEYTACGLIGLGVQTGDAVAILAPTSYEWLLLDLALLSIGAITVPIYESDSAAQIEHILTDAHVTRVFTATTQQAELVHSVAPEYTVAVDSFDRGAQRMIARAATGITIENVEQRRAAISSSDIATIIYTSGTTGNPKGVALTHANFVATAEGARQVLGDVIDSPATRLLLFLPLAHVFARFLQVFQISGNGVLGHASNIKNLLGDLASFKPSYLLVVPRVLEKIYNSADTKASGPKRKIFRWAAKVAIAYSQALDTEEGPSASLKAQHALADKLVYQQIIRLVGGNADYIVSGGAPLAPWLAHFYRGVGIPVLEGYGLTETVGPVSVNTPRLSKIGTVGPALPPMSFKISDEGEILLKGSSVFQRYHNDPEATAACFTEDGWFRTGDLGSLDRDGYVSITGRAKEIIVTAGGKNVAPAALENPMRSHPLISQVLVVGDQRPFIAALITLDAEMLPDWLTAHSLPPMSVAEAATNVEVLASLEKAVASANEHVSRAESIRKIKVLTTDFTEANGLLTPSLKVKRLEATRRLAPIIDEIYGGPIQN